ncbi:MAG: vitamin B12-dependent ribonucleotide reductase [Lentisphaerae bacterium]|nr:vitamin B12-dependent ribonucleotide reductase [Lentisphaerota bacterium]
MLNVREPADVEPETEQSAKPTRRFSVGKAVGEGAQPSSAEKKFMKVDRVFTRPGVSPFDDLEWERRRASIGDDKGNEVFAQDDVEVPKSWSMLATNVVASKYFYGTIGTSDREHSVRQLVHRVARTIADWGLKDGYFASAEDAEVFYNELAYVCVHQYGAFNSPVWFNVGLHHVYGHTSPSRHAYAWDQEKGEIALAGDTYRHPQSSACFIQAVDDSMEDIMRLASAEAMLFKFGSGTGTDLSTIRSSRERLSGGGTPSGPLSFMRVYDQVAAVIKSGGKTRRAAKMQSLKCHHPDIVEFINAKSNEEQKAWALIENGYDGSFGGEAYESVMFQNANLSVRVTDEFMRAVEQGGKWQTRAVTTGAVVETLDAREMMKNIASGAHICGDPGLQYDSTINRWHTCKQSGPINASNPCSEYMFLDDSACNLASINLMKVVDAEGTFDLKRFRHVVRLLITAQDILVDNASYPTARIALNSHLYRPLGLGYANLGALLMRQGLPYDSDEGRAYAGTITALMHGYANSASQELAEVSGPFDGFERNRRCMLDVMRMHQDALTGIDPDRVPTRMYVEAVRAWDHVVHMGDRSGFRNAQVTVLAPTGTIGFMMDCDTTGVEPDIALVKYKQLAGGGVMKLVNRTVPAALQRLGYNAEASKAIVDFIEKNDTIEGAPGLDERHLPVFDCAFKPVNGTRTIPYKAHLHMMAAVQPFLSGAISKTVNLPKDATPEQILETYMEGWRLGLKAVAIYRDGSKRTQPLSTSKSGGAADAAEEDVVDAETQAVRNAPFRRRMPATRNSITHKFDLAGHEGYLTVGVYEDGLPGELFITMAKEGSTVGGIMDSFGTAISLCLQYGVPVKELCRKFSHTRFEPSGFTKNADIPMAKSIVDYIFRWLDQTFPDGKAEQSVRRPLAAATATLALAPAQPVVADKAGGTSAIEDRVDGGFEHFMTDAPVCDVCGSITVRNGACYRCFNCGNSMGCS